MIPNNCARCNEVVWPERAKWLCDLVDKVMAVLPEPLATEFGDNLVFGPLPYECIEFSTDIERVILCDTCTLNAINRAVTA